AHVSVGFSGLRYFGATGPRVPPRTPLTRNPLAVRRESLASWSCTARRSSITFELRAASTWSLNFDNLSIDIDLRFMGALPALCLFHLGRDCRENQLHYGRDLENRACFWSRRGAVKKHGLPHRYAPVIAGYGGMPTSNARYLTPQNG